MQFATLLALLPAALVAAAPAAPASEIQDRQVASGCYAFEDPDCGINYPVCQCANGWFYQFNQDNANNGNYCNPPWGILAKSPAAAIGRVATWNPSSRNLRAHSFQPGGRLDRVLRRAGLLRRARMPHRRYLDTGKHSGAVIKCMTALSVDETEVAKVTVAGQSFRNGEEVGDLVVERLGPAEPVTVQDSEAVPVMLDDE
ncbi:a2cb185b-0f6d-41f2-87c2-abdb57f95f0c [Thermothielavioides terrestris]|uniref:A2cb185b-0f6d-41f2-87c2-abdb57f95f0c n=1 Tax=Thermothielavioides terrestris TaxID=2587410 RepID=A0A446BRE2_9PEZI|nr:a2cb185b-0f6d-41f2-87c2-abdb57f95f0c [Thermothielavioides terrestris]